MTSPHYVTIDGQRLAADPEAVLILDETGFLKKGD
jgi:hypothetical protein